MIATLLAAVALAPTDGLAVGERAVFEAKTMAGASVLSSTLTAKPTVLVLWGPWSSGAARALVDLSRVAKTDTRARFVALATWDEPENVKKFLATVSGVDLEVWTDPAMKDASDSIAVRVFKTRRFPSVYVLDRSQRVSGSFLGYKASDDIVGSITKAIGRED
jgi:hypothetical protein